MTNKSRVHQIITLFVVLIPSVLSLYLFFRLDILSTDYLYLENENEVLVENLEKRVNYSQSIEKQMESDIKYYKELNGTKNEIISNLQYEKKIDSHRNNPVDEFFDSQILIDYGTLAITHADHMYQGAWHDELIHAYSILNEMAHNDIKTYINLSLSNVIDFAYNEGEVRSAAEASDAFGNEFGDLSENISYGTISRSISAWETAEILKNQTLKVHRYIIENGGVIDFIFDADETFRKAEGLFVSEDFLNDYYKIIEKQNGYVIELLDEKGNRIYELPSKSKPQVSLHSNYQLRIEVSAGSDATYTHIYNVNDAELSAPYFNRLYLDKYIIVHTVDDALVISFIFWDLKDDIIIERNWSQVGVLKHAIKEVEIVDWKILKLTYLMEDDYVEVTEYIDLD